MAAAREPPGERGDADLRGADLGREVMRKEHNAHPEPLKHTDDEARRVAGVYAGYAADAARQRAWSGANPGNQAIRDELVAALLPWVPSGGDVLDAGCGSGWLLARLAAEGVAEGRLHGVDVLEQRVATAAEALPGAHLRAADVRSLPAGDGSMSLVIFLTVLSSLAGPDDVAAALREARRVVAPSGHVAVWEPRVPTPGNRATRLIRRADLTAALGPAIASRPLTVAPPLARRLGAAAPRAYPALARVHLLLTHRLMVFRTG
jgi:SAM-dependent methyltransferase